MIIQTKKEQMIFSELPFVIKGHVLSFIGEYTFRKGRIDEVFIPRISRERIAEVKILFENTPSITTWKKGNIWRSRVEFSSSSPIWRIIYQNFEYDIENEEDIRILPEIVCYYERSYIHSNHVYHTPII